MVVRPTVALQVFSYDVRDEGAEPCLAAARLAGAEVVLLCVSHWDAILPALPGRERRLPHNPTRSSHGSGAYFRPVGTYPAALRPSDEPGDLADGDTAWSELAPPAHDTGISVIPWVHLLTDRVALGAPAHAMRNAAGQIVPGWLCPSHADVVDFACARVSDVIEKLGPPAIFIDRIRFPDWGLNGFIDSCTCFCDACHDLAATQGLYLAQLREPLLSFAELLRRDPARASRISHDAVGSAVGTLRTTSDNDAVLHWLRFRHFLIERLVRKVSEVVRGRCELWLDVWPPSWAWILGQDLRRLAPYATWIKPMVYHRRSGGSDIPGFIASLSPDPTIQDAAYQTFRALFAFPGPANVQDLLIGGLDPLFITQELQLANNMLDGRSHLAAGIEVYACGPQGVVTALDHAATANPVGYFINNFAVAELDELAAVGEWIQQRANGNT